MMYQIGSWDKVAYQYFDGAVARASYRDRGKWMAVVGNEKKPNIPLCPIQGGVGSPDDFPTIKQPMLIQLGKGSADDDLYRQTIK